MVINIGKLKDGDDQYVRNEIARVKHVCDKREALTPISGPTVSLINLTSLAVAPPVENPVEVLTKSALASLDSLQALTFSSSVNKQVSIITFNTIQVMFLYVMNY